MIALYILFYFIVNKLDINSDRTCLVHFYYLHENAKQNQELEPLDFELGQVGAHSRITVISIYSHFDLQIIVGLWPRPFYLCSYIVRP
jgi:hypothetical protein